MRPSFTPTALFTLSLLLAAPPASADGRGGGRRLAGWFGGWLGGGDDAAISAARELTAGVPLHNEHVAFDAPGQWCASTPPRIQYLQPSLHTLV